MTTTADRRTHIQLSGPDSRKFLQGQVTCDMALVTDGSVINGAHCTPKGRMIFLFSATCDEHDNIILQTHQSVADIAIASLTKYAVFFKTQISDVTEQYATQSIESNLVRLRSGCADVVAETSDMFIPQMLNLDALGYISFKKGCYTGQEIIARAHYRGAVKRRMHHLKMASTALPRPGDPIQDSEGKAIGTIASAVQVNDATVEVLAVLADKSVGCTKIQVGLGALTAITHLPLPYEIPASP